MQMKYFGSGWCRNILRKYWFVFGVICALTTIENDIFQHFLGPYIRVWPPGNRCHLLGTFFDLLGTLTDLSGALLDLPGTLFDLLRTFSDLLGPWFGLPGMLSDGEYWSFFHWNHGCICNSAVTHLVMLSCNAFKSMKYVGTFILQPSCNTRHVTPQWLIDSLRKRLNGLPYSPVSLWSSKQIPNDVQLISVQSYS